MKQGATIIASLVLAIAFPMESFAQQRQTATPATELAILGHFVGDIQYGYAGGESLKLDADTPDGAGPFPVAIIVHGGGWSGGDKGRDITPLFTPLTQGHFVWFSINYRLAPKYPWPACFEDVQTAIRWVKAHAATYKGDPKRIALIGESAGGHLVCLAATSGGEGTAVQAVVGFAAPTDMVADTERRGGLSVSAQALIGRKTFDDTARQILHQMSPINYVKPGMPPFLLIHGTADRSVLYQQSINFQAALTSMSIPCQLITIDKGVHGMAKWETLDTSYKAKMVAWLTQTLGQ
ncbi:MAG: alpha/beta hydrolase [Tepidisphaeraceae bacterium]|jgi:alpha-L-fucosidase 2